MSTAELRTRRTNQGNQTKKQLQQFSIERRRICRSYKIFNSLIFLSHVSRRLLRKRSSDGSIRLKQMGRTIIERFRQFYFFTKRSILLVENSRKTNLKFLHSFSVEQKCKVISKIPFSSMLVV